MGMGMGEWAWEGEWGMGDGWGMMGRDAVATIPRLVMDHHGHGEWPPLCRPIREYFNILSPARTSHGTLRPVSGSHAGMLACWHAGANQRGLGQGRWGDVQSAFGLGGFGGWDYWGFGSCVPGDPKEKSDQHHDTG